MYTMHTLDHLVLGMIHDGAGQCVQVYRMYSLTSSEEPGSVTFFKMVLM